MGAAVARYRPGPENHLFAGSPDAARRAAGIYRLMRTCAQYGVPPLPYFTDVLSRLGNGWDAARLDDLLPHRWQPPAVKDLWAILVRPSMPIGS